MDAAKDPFFKRSSEKRAVFDQRFRPLPMRRRDRLQWETQLHPRISSLAILLGCAGLLAIAFGLQHLRNAEKASDAD